MLCVIICVCNPCTVDGRNHNHNRNHIFLIFLKIATIADRAQKSNRIAEQRQAIEEKVSRNRGLDEQIADMRQQIQAEERNNPAPGPQSIDTNTNTNTNANANASKPKPYALNNVSADISSESMDEPLLATGSDT